MQILGRSGKVQVDMNSVSGKSRNEWKGYLQEDGR